MYRTSVLFILICLFNSGEFSKILGVFPSPGYSQFILAKSLMTELARRGHEVTVIAPFEPKTPVKNYRTILLDGMFKLIEGEYMKIYKRKFYV